MVVSPLTIIQKKQGQTPVMGILKIYMKFCQSVKVKRTRNIAAVKDYSGFNFLTSFEIVNIFFCVWRSDECNIFRLKTNIYKVQIFKNICIRRFEALQILKRVIVELNSLTY